MYLRADGFSGHNSAGEQIRQRGLFLLLVQCEGRECPCVAIKACVRKVALRQLGHWMMGRARIYGHSVVTSGSYGGDGLPVTVPHAVYERLSTKLPPDLVEAWSKGGGWNGAGSEAPAMRAWALANLPALQG
jgi:hypothetical protein